MPAEEASDACGARLCVPIFAILKSDAERDEGPGND
jgi:hypothetical protein